MGQDDALCGKQILDHPQAERKPEIYPNRIGYDIGRKAMAVLQAGGGHDVKSHITPLGA